MLVDKAQDPVARGLQGKLQSTRRPGGHWPGKMQVT